MIFLLKVLMLMYKILMKIPRFIVQFIVSRRVAYLLSQKTVNVNIKGRTGYTPFIWPVSLTSRI
jgi:hypothetical protein